jgi:hypothetical protein
MRPDATSLWGLKLLVYGALSYSCIRGYPAVDVLSAPLYEALISYYEALISYYEALISYYEALISYYEAFISYYEAFISYHKLV